MALLLTAGTLALLAPASARADSAPADPANPATPVTVTADGLPTTQINGVAWSQVVVGNKVYVAGSFSTARPAGAAAGTNEVPRNNLLAYDIRTGELDTTFQPNLNAQALVVAASPDGSRIYVGGDFTQANGQARNRVAAYSTATGQLVDTFRPSVAGQVRAIAATDSTVYLGGGFSAVGSVARTRLAAVSAANGALLPWAPVTGVGPTDGNDDGNKNTSDHVMALVLTGGGSQVVAAGRFWTLNGQRATGIGALDATTGATRPFAISQLVTNHGINSAIYSLSTDGQYVYGTGYDFYGPGNVEGSFKVTADGGNLEWMNDCHGDTYSNFAMNGALYIAGHPHVCSNIDGYPEHNPRIHRYATATSLVATGRVGHETVANNNFTGKPAPSLLPWFPTMTPGTVTGAAQAGWSVSGNSQYVVYGGEFPRVNGKPQQGLVRYALPSIAPNKIAPSADGFTASAVAIAPGAVRVSWPSATDQDNQNLTYRVYRDGATGTAIHTVTKPSVFWDRPSLAFVDTTAGPGTHTYRVSASDPAGNRINTAWVTVEVTAGTTAPRAYAEAVRSDGAESLWPLSDTTGGSRDWIGGNDLTLGSGVNRGRPGAITGDPNSSFEFTGRSSSFAASSKTGVWAPNTFSVEAWFQTTSTKGGKIIGFGNRTSGTSTSYDRHVYMDLQGRVIFGVYPGAERTVSGAPGYNDGRWHHVVASLGKGGMALYIDGKLVGSRADTWYGENNLGYWRIGGDSAWGNIQPWFDGRIDEPAVYPEPLSADRVLNHYSLGTTGQGTNLSPTAAFTSTATYLTAAFDAAGSTDADGTVSAYAWDFGDGTTGTGRQTGHAYTAAGTFAVKLTVTDDKGATATRTQNVTVTAPPPNQAPEAAFTAAMNGLKGSFDATSSTDADGTVATYAWDFGDGRTATGATAAHTYATDGTYLVKLRVTDDDGATDTTEQSVQAVTATVLASDSFQRTVSGGLGAAEVGGPWTVSFGPTRQSVSPGTATLQLAAPGNNTGSYLGDVSQTSADVRTTFSLSAAPTGAGTYVYVRGRVVGTYQEYRARLRMLATGAVALSFTRQTGTATETLIGGEVVVPGLTYVPGTPLNVRVQVSGTGTAELAATVWADGTSEPATPTVTRTDSTASLQAPGGVGISAYLSGSATAPLAVRVTGLTAVPVGAPAPTPNVAPTAAFVSTTSGLTGSFDGTGSTDPDGTVAGHVWDFGDGTTGTGATTTHPYAAAGTYTVRLTVTDDDGATGSVERPVTVTAPNQPEEPEEPGVTPFASDAFDRTVTGGLGTADVGGPWTVTFGGTRQSVAPGAATLALQAPGNNTGSYLGGVSETSTDLRTSFSLSAAPTGAGTYVYVRGRVVGTNQEYRARLRMLANGSVALAFTRQEGTATDVLIGTEVVVPGLTYVPGATLNVRVQVSGTGTTQLAATVWSADAQEPAAPQLTRTDQTASLQAPGGVGISAYLSGSATTPVSVRVTRFSAAPVAD
ncbi:PKD domain-containing protein [Blastococcus haudaquaticus]|uniref:PKD domain-containing protein n=1 Tax=Blastococcus haudaquaticus TaxID=1938745 RepID=UPI001F24DD9A|nr:PKD domain-containing protein [Blastococcus haudaquaticus]